MSSDAAAAARPSQGLLVIVSAPSGAGKTTLVERLVEQVPHLRMSRSYTSRPARPGETDGVDYNFVTRERFEMMIAPAISLNGPTYSAISTAPAPPIPTGCSPPATMWYW